MIIGSRPLNRTSQPLSAKEVPPLPVDTTEDIASAKRVYGRTARQASPFISASAATFFDIPIQAAVGYPIRTGSNGFQVSLSPVPEVDAETNNKRQRRSTASAGIVISFYGIGGKKYA